MAAKVLAEFNPHRFLHLNLYKVDPVQLLVDLNETISDEQTNFEFHNEMAKIFSTMNDLHTVYVRPRPLRNSMATLLFTVERIFEKGEWRYIVSDFASGIDLDSPKPSSFRVGSEILSYDGEPTDMVVKRLGKESYGSNPAAQTFRGKNLLTIRMLGIDEVPLEESVSILYRNTDGATMNIKVKWVFTEDTGLDDLNRLYSQLEPFPNGDRWTRNLPKYQELALQHALLEPFSTVSGDRRNLSKRNSAFRRAFKQSRISFKSGWTQSRGESAYRYSNGKPSVFWKNLKSTIQSEHNAHELNRSGTVRVSNRNRTTLPTSTLYEDELAAEIVHTSKGAIGRLRLSSFSVSFDSQFIEEIARVLRLMPKAGLVVDLRDNLEGEADVTRDIAELLTDKIVPPKPRTLRASEPMLSFLDGWSNETSSEEFRVLVNAQKEAVKSALLVGEMFSGPTTDLNVVQSLGRNQTQVYKGPVVTLVSGNTYSAGDDFAAMQVDQNMSVLVGVDENTGAGGASILSYSFLERLAPTVFQPLPFGVYMSTAFSRFYRTGTSSGKIIEFFGVKPQIVYNLTRADALKEGCDLYEFLANVLRKERKRRLIGAIILE